MNNLGLSTLSLILLKFDFQNGNIPVYHTSFFDFSSENFELNQS